MSGRRAPSMVRGGARTAVNAIDRRTATTSRAREPAASRIRGGRRRPHVFSACPTTGRRQKAAAGAARPGLCGGAPSPTGPPGTRAWRSPRGRRLCRLRRTTSTRTLLHPAWVPASGGASNPVPAPPSPIDAARVPALAVPGWTDTPFTLLSGRSRLPDPRLVQRPTRATSTRLRGGRKISRSDPGQTTMHALFEGGGLEHDCAHGGRLERARRTGQRPAPGPQNLRWDATSRVEDSLRV